MAYPDRALPGRHGKATAIVELSPPTGYRTVHGAQSVLARCPQARNVPRNRMTNGMHISYHASACCRFMKQENVPAKLETFGFATSLR